MLFLNSDEDEILFECDKSEWVFFFWVNFRNVLIALKVL